MTKKNLYLRFYKIVQQIPKGSVATYGQIADLAGLPGYARQVGYALHAIPDGLDVPWHRVINSKGMISLRSTGPFDQVQRSLLEAEGVEFSKNGRVSLAIFQWVP